MLPPCCHHVNNKNHYAGVLEKATQMSPKQSPHIMPLLALALFWRSHVLDCLLASLDLMPLTHIISHFQPTRAPSESGM